MRLKNKVVLITGASSGLGKATTIEFAKKNCKLILVARRIDKLEELKRRLFNINRNILIVKADIGNSKDITNLFKIIKINHGYLNILVNNAGRGLNANLLDITEEEWDSVHNVNVKGVFLVTKEAVKLMKYSKKSAHIVTVSSIAGLYGAPGYSAYCSSKHAVTGFKRSLRFELWKFGIKTSTIFPARINTDFFSNYQNKPSSKQMLSPKDIAQYLVAMAERKFILSKYLKIRNIFKRIITLIVK